MDPLLKLLCLFGIISASPLIIKKIKNTKKKKMIERLKNTKMSTQYESVLASFIPYQKLTKAEKDSFHWKFLYFLNDKIFSPVGGISITEEMKIWVAAEATLMITNLESDVYPGLKNIYIAEGTFIPKDNPINPMTGLPTHTARLGEAWKSGPIVLSWNAIAQGSSVVFHEFSHHLDQQDGTFDGTPCLGRNGNYDRWAHVMGKAFLSLMERIERHRSSDIDTYGATNEAEFFAVVTEYYFTRASMLNEKHPDIYSIYESYFKLNPLRWC